jgi:hypothetical protein
LLFLQERTKDIIIIMMARCRDHVLHAAQGRDAPPLRASLVASRYHSLELFVLLETRTFGGLTILPVDHLLVRFPEQHIDVCLSK